MTETVSTENVVISSEPSPSCEKIAERKTIVYETRTDPTVIKMAGEKIKDQLFTRYGFLKPKPDEIQFVRMEKFYEPYMLITGKYSIDYYRKCLYTVNIDKDVLEVILLQQTFTPQTPLNTKDRNNIILEGEERLKIQTNTSLILDKNGKDVTLEKLPSAPSEKNPKKVLAAHNVQEIAPDKDLEIIRARIVKRPNNVSRLVSELFEVDERAVIYTPRFNVTFRNTKTNEEKTIEFDGVTAEKIRETKTSTSPDQPPPPPPP